jgi:DNA-binding XRE family transcriptional regulator
MTKNTNSIHSTPPEAKQSLINLGLRIRANRMAQGWTIQETAARLFCSQNTYRSIESGKPSSSIGILVNALWLFGILDSLDALAPVPLNMGSMQRVRHSHKKSHSHSIEEDERDF